MESFFESLNGMKVVSASQSLNLNLYDFVWNLNYLTYNDRPRGDSSSSVWRGSWGDGIKPSKL